MDYIPFHTSTRTGGVRKASRFGSPRSTPPRRVRARNVRARIENRDGDRYLVPARRIPHVTRSRPRATKRYALIEFDQKTGRVFEAEEAKDE